MFSVAATSFSRGGPAATRVRAKMCPGPPGHGRDPIEVLVFVLTPPHLLPEKAPQHGPFQRGRFP
jgi:hypothetical protein